MSNLVKQFIRDDSGASALEYGLVVGLIESYTTQFINPGLTDIVVFTLLLLLLALRPTGLIAEKREENV